MDFRVGPPSRRYTACQEGLADAEVAIVGLLIRAARAEVRVDIERTDQSLFEERSVYFHGAGQPAKMKVSDFHLVEFLLVMMWATPISADCGEDPEGDDEQSVRHLGVRVGSWAHHTILVESWQ